MSLEYPPKRRRKPIFKEEAVQRITELTLNLASEESVDSDTTFADLINSKPLTLEFYLNGLIGRILDYCHRKDFPEPLIYLCAEMILTLLRGQLINSDNDAGVDGLISKVKLGDSEFDFDTGLTKLKYTSITCDNFFNQLKPNLNIYRRLKSY